MSTKLEKIFEKDVEIKYPSILGKYVIIRSRNEGINAGTLKYYDEHMCVIENCKRLWRPISKDTNFSWYEGVAETGLHERSIVSGEVLEKIIVENYSITLVKNENIEKLIRDFPPNKTEI